jgi:hypothetical protein
VKVFAKFYEENGKIRKPQVQQLQAVCPVLELKKHRQKCMNQLPRQGRTIRNENIAAVAGWELEHTGGRLLPETLPPGKMCEPLIIKFSSFPRSPSSVSCWLKLIGR